MNPILERALVITFPVLAILVAAVVAVLRARTFYAVCWLAGAVCFVVVVLTHAAEGMHWLPAMRWGQPHSAGHYVDFTSAVLGAVLLVVGSLARIRYRR